MMDTVTLASFEALPLYSQLALALTAGFLSCLTPCVYPLIPITVATFEDRAESSRLRMAGLAAIYVLGLVFTYTILGVAAGSGGYTFGFILANPVAVALMALVLVIFAMHSLELLELRFFSFLQRKAGQLNSGGRSGVFLTGAMSGLIAAPCIGPVLAVVLAVAASSQNGAYGALLLLTYSLGIGIPVFALAFFSEILGRLPKSGSWMRAIHFLTATALILVVLFLLQHYLSPLLALCSTISHVITLSAIFLFVILGLVSYRFESRILRAIAALGLAMAICPFLLSPSQSSISWHPRLETALDEALATNKPVMLDFYADWCSGCKELDLTTLENPNVLKELEHFVLARIDLTVSSDYTDEITGQFNVSGLPSILFLTPDGQEIELSRISGYLPAERFADHLKEVLR